MNNIQFPTAASIVFSCFALLLSTLTLAETNDDICQAGTVVAFFNGVQTTPSGANRAKEVLASTHGDKNNDGDIIKYEMLYNYSNGFEDFVETFEQRLKEQDDLLEGRFELFFEALDGNSSWWSTIIEAVPAAQGILESFTDWYQAAAIEALAGLAANPPTDVNYAEHKTRIDNWILEGNKLVFVAHSQGNLFANAAYEHAINKASRDSVKLIHIAPASPSTNGPHTLADLDLVINGLRLVGSVPSTTNSIPGYLFRPSGINGRKDILGHGILEIYLNERLSVSNRIKSQINSALESVEAPPAEAAPGFFTATLTWNGTGDVDLHTFEPTGTHVYYLSKGGDSGYLDVDNTHSFGPEHYFASCDASKLQTGTYKIAIANYARAEGRTATVQVAYWNGGVLGTKSVTLGEETKNDPAYSLFNVLVTQDDETEQYSATIAQEQQK